MSNSFLTPSVLDNSVIEELRSLQKPGRPDVFLGLVSLFLETATESASKIQVSISERNFKGLADAAHSLKSSSANIGAIQLSKVCLELEKIGEGDSDLGQLNKFAGEFTREFSLVLDELTAIRAAA